MLQQLIKHDFDKDRLNDDLEKRSFLLFAISAIMFGINSTFIKLSSVIYVNTFDSNSFLLWRSITLVCIAIYTIRHKNIRFMSLNEFKDNKFWFYTRTIGNFFAFIAFIQSMVYLRASTAVCISSMYPAFVIIFSIFILKEAFHMRYIIGLVVCFVGAALIILNDKKENDTVINTGIQNEDDDSIGVVIGILYGVFHVISIALVNVSSKVLADQKIPFDILMFYTGLSNFICGIIAALIIGNCIFNALFILISVTNGALFYIASAIMYESVKLIDLSKLSPLAYLTPLSVFVTGIIFFGENIYFTDIIGSLLILSFNVYNSLNPILD